MNTLWFCLIAAMLVVFVLLDGFDLGVGILHLGLARSDSERKTLIASISAVCEANEVWLIATGGTLYCVFPTLYASSFSGFYLALMMLLWLLMLRGISIEFRNHVAGPIWAPLWDVVFCYSSALIAIFFGFALGNVVRGVPLDATGFFFEPLWTQFGPSAETGILDWYTALTGITAYFALTQHGALWAALRAGDGLSSRARHFAATSWWVVVALTGVVTYASFRVQPRIAANFMTRPWGFFFPCLALVGLGSIRWWLYVYDKRADISLDRNAFASSCAYLVGMLSSAAFGIYPWMLPSRGNPAYSLTIENAAAGKHGLEVALIWWSLGMALACTYFIFVYRHLDLGDHATKAAEPDPRIHMH